MSTAPSTPTGASETVSPPDPEALGRAIRQRRRALGLTLSGLGERCGLSVAFLSLLERGKSAASLGSLASISEALGVSLNYFVAMPSRSHERTCADERPQFRAGERMYERVTSDFPGHMMSGLIVHVPPGHVSEVLASGGEHFLYMLSGSVQVMISDQKHRLTVGDTLHFQASRPHQLTNPNASTASLLWVGTNPLL